MYLYKCTYKETRFYFDFDSVDEEMEDICQNFENCFKDTNIDLYYDVNNLFEFIDCPQNITFSTFDKNSFAKDWIEEKLYFKLQLQANYKLV